MFTGVRTTRGVAMPRSLGTQSSLSCQVPNNALLALLQKAILKETFYTTLLVVSGDQACTTRSF